MSALAQQLSTTGIANSVFSERQLGEFLGGSDARRYGVVNRALRDGSLIRLKRGAYVLGQRYRRNSIHPFAIAQGLVAGRYISRSEEHPSELPSIMRISYSAFCLKKKK